MFTGYQCVQCHQYSKMYHREGLDSPKKEHKDEKEENNDESDLPMLLHVHSVHVPTTKLIVDGQVRSPPLAFWGPSQAERPLQIQVVRQIQTCLLSTALLRHPQQAPWGPSQHPRGPSQPLVCLPALGQGCLGSLGPLPVPLSEVQLL